MALRPPQYPAAAAASSAANGGASGGAVSGTSSSIGGSDVLSFPAWDSPPQASYGWFVDVPPPRGPYFWPLQPEAYKLRPQVKSEEKAVGGGSGEAHSSSSDDAFAYAPQMCFGWFAALPPPQPPFLWPALPEGYVMVRADEVDQSLGASVSGSSSGQFASPSRPSRQPSAVTTNPLAHGATLPQPHAINTTAPPPPSAHVHPAMQLPIPLHQLPMGMFGGLTPLHFASLAGLAPPAPSTPATAMPATQAPQAAMASSPATTLMPAHSPAPVAATPSPAVAVANAVAATVAPVPAPMQTQAATATDTSAAMDIEPTVPAPNTRKKATRARK